MRRCRSAGVSLILPSRKGSLLLEGGELICLRALEGAGPGVKTETGGAGWENLG